MTVLGIIAALPQEYRCFTKRPMQAQEVYQVKPGLLISFAGMGETNASHAAQLLMQQGAHVLLSFGLACGFNNALDVAAAVLPTEICHEHERIKVDPTWHTVFHQQLEDKLSVFVGQHGHCPQVIKTQEQKSAYAKRGIDAGDMESMAVARVAHTCAVPFIILRVVLDPANLSLPDFVPKLVNNFGQLQAKALWTNSRAILTQLPQLLTLAKYSRQSKQRMQELASNVLAIV